MWYILKKKKKYKAEVKTNAVCELREFSVESVSLASMPLLRDVGLGKDFHFIHDKETNCTEMLGEGLRKMVDLG